jgi:hypothetical protein
MLESHDPTTSHVVDVGHDTLEMPAIQSASFETVHTPPES